MKQLVGSAFFWFAAFLALGDIAAGFCLPYRLVPNAEEAIRNPLKHRGWPEYLDADSGGRPLVVLISNSQGVGGEIDDSRKIYAAALRDHLAESGFAFENWSMGGLRTTEVELLTIEAARRRATHVLMLLTVNNFDVGERVDLKFPFSDLKLLVGSPGNWPHLHGAIFRERASFDDVAAAFLGFSSDLVRSRIAVEDLAGSRIPLKLHPLTLGREVRPGERFDAMRDPNVSIYFPAVDDVALELKRRRDARIGQPVEWAADQVDARLETFRAVYPGIRSRLAASGTGLTWVWHPLAPGSSVGESLVARDRFLASATALIAGSGGTCNDMTDAVNARFFMDQGHFDEAGHREFARMLLPIVDAALGEDGRGP
jgi:hypothetical protein